MESISNFINSECIIESEVYSVLSGIVDSVVQLEILECERSFEPEKEQESELFKATSDPTMKEIFDRVVEHLAKSAEAEIAEFAVEFKSIGTDTDDLVKLRTFSTNTVHLAVNLVNSATDTNDLVHRFASDVEMNTDSVKIISGEYIDASTCCDVEMKDEETCMNDFGGKLMIEIGIGTSDYDAEVNGDEGQKTEDAERNVVETILKKENGTATAQFYSMEFQETLEMDLDVPFYPDKIRRVAKNKKVTTLGNENQVLKKQPTFRRKNPASALSDISNGDSCAAISDIYGLKGSKKPSSFSQDTRTTVSDTSTPYGPEDKENVGSNKYRAIHPYLRLGLSKRGRTLKPLHTHVQLKVEEEPDRADAEDEEEDDED